MFRDVNAEIRKTFRRARLRYTSQRHAMREHLWQSAGHLTAEQIFAGIALYDPRASRATVYNNLHALARAVVLQEVTLRAGAVGYDIDVRRDHHRSQVPETRCRSCGQPAVPIAAAAAGRKATQDDWKEKLNGKSCQTGCGTGGRQR